MKRAILLLLTVSILTFGCINTQEPIVGSDTDGHGCKGSAGYSWCEAKQKCLRVWEEPCDAKLTLEQAREIARNSDCMLEGNLTDESSYNNVTDTWWLGTDIVKEGCSPACVVDEKTETAEINWRCTGLIPE